MVMRQAWKGETYLEITITHGFVTWNRSLIYELFRTNLAACTLIPNAASRTAFSLRTRGLPSKLLGFHLYIVTWRSSRPSKLNLLLDATPPLFRSNIVQTTRSYFLLIKIYSFLFFSSFSFSPFLQCWLREGRGDDDCIIPEMERCLHRQVWKRI